MPVKIHNRYLVGFRRKEDVFNVTGFFLRHQLILCMKNDRLDSSNSLTVYTLVTYTTDNIHDSNGLTKSCTCTTNFCQEAKSKRFCSGAKFVEL